MYGRKREHAAIGVANKRAAGSRWAEHRTRCGKYRRLGHVADLVGGSLVAASFLVTSASTLAQTERTVERVPKEIAALDAKVASLQETVSALKDEIASLQSQLAAVQSNPALALGPFVGVDTNSENGVAGPHITFKGANIHIVSGSGVTSDNDNPTGLGNLIIGYDEPPGELRGTDRGGSHNLVIGRYNRFTRAAVGGIVAGELNTISNREASVTGGATNTASGLQACVSGGGFNTASGEQTSVSGGVNNNASGSGDSVSGGDGNTATGTQASVSGGTSNQASGNRASINGGNGNVASGNEASVTGGTGNTASGSATVIIGGQNITDEVGGSIRPQPPFTP
jgi:trimeric autotransporter adhesin